MNTIGKSPWLLGPSGDCCHYRLRTAHFTTSRHRLDDDCQPSFHSQFPRMGLERQLGPGHKAIRSDWSFAARDVPHSIHRRSECTRSSQVLKAVQEETSSTSLEIFQPLERATKPLISSEGAAPTSCPSRVGLVSLQLSMTCFVLFLTAFI